MAGAYKAGADRSHRRLTHWIEALDVWSTKARSGHRRPDNWRGTVDLSASKAER